MADSPSTFEFERPTSATAPPDLSLDNAVAPDGGPYEVGESDRKWIMNRVRADLARAKSKKATLNSRAKHYRDVIDLEPKTPAYEGAPTITLPLVRSKYDGVVAHLTDALDIEPYFSAKGKTEQGMLVAPVWEALQEREMAATHSKEMYLASIPEAAAVGTAILGWTIGHNDVTNEPFIQEIMPTFESVFAYPTAVDDFTNCTVYVRHRYPWFVLDRMGRMGLLNRKLVSDLHERGSDTDGQEALSYQTADASTDGDFSPEQRVHTLWEAYVRWEGELWRVMFSEGQQDAMSLVRNPFRSSFNAPAYENVRIMRRPGYLWGMGIPQLLDAIQKIMDNAENSRLSYNTFAMNPVVMADRLNPFLVELQDGGLLPNQVIPTMGTPDTNGVKILEFPKPDVTIEEMELAQRFADLATFTDFQMQGAPFAASRRTATEVRTGFNIGTLKLRKMLRDVRLDHGRAGKKRWALTHSLKIAPAGVVPVFKDSKQYLLSSDGVTAEELDAYYEEFTAQQGISVTPEQRLAELSRLEHDYSFVDGQIPSVKRDDIEWVVNGSDIIPDKQAELQKLDGFAPYMNWLPYAKEDSRIWYFLKVRLQLMNRPDWQQFVGEDPRKKLPEQQYAQVMQTLMQQSSQLANNGTQSSGGS